MIKISDDITMIKILKYLKKNLTDCIYLAIDLERYGYAVPEVAFWYSEKDGEPDTVLMKYYDSIQLYSANENWDTEGCMELIKKYSVMTICAKRDMIKRLEPLATDYSTQYGIIVKEDTYREFEQFKNIREAVPEDAHEIALLMQTDEDFRDNYTLEGLEKQLRDRMQENRGRSYIIVEDGKIVAHTAAFAECEDIAVESGLIVHEDYKKKFYGMIVHEYMKKRLIEDGKTAYGFRITESMQRYANAGNINICGYYGKMTKKIKEGLK